MTGQMVDVGDTRLHIVERGSGYPIIILHGGPGLDHHMFGDYLDALGDEFRLILVDQRNHGLSERAPDDTWTFQQNAADVSALATALSLEQYATLGHSYGAFVVLQHAVDFPGDAAQTIVSAGVPSASKYLGPYVAHQLETFEPEELRHQVTSSWAREATVRTQEEVEDILADQFPFHFANPRDSRLEEFLIRTSGAVYAPEVLRKFANEDYGGIEVEDRLGAITQPVLVLAGRHDRACSIEAAQAIKSGVFNAELVIFENSGHMTFVEENENYLATVRDFLKRCRG